MSVFPQSTRLGNHAEWCRFLIIFRCFNALYQAAWLLTFNPHEEVIMPLNQVNTGTPIPNVLANPNAAQHANSQAVIAQLTFANLGRGPMTLHTVGVARLDMQGHTAAGAANLQVQIGGQTIAAAVVAATALVAAGGHQNGVAHAARAVLVQSMNTGTIWHLNGALP